MPMSTNIGSQFEDRYMRIGAINTRYWQAGTQGSPVLLLHGIACSVLEWEANLEALAAHHRVFAVDLLGFGRTDKPDDETYTIRRLAQFVLDCLAYLELPWVHLAGNSLGGRIALECALMAPERVASLVLSDPAGIDKRGTLFEFCLSTLPVLGELLSSPNRFGTRMIWRKAFADPSFVTEELLDAKLELARLPGAKAVFLKTLRSFVDFSGFRSDPVEALQAALPQIKAPTLVIWGRQDRFVSVAHTEVLQRLLPNVQIQIWEGCGHLPQLEYAARFNQTTLDFWSKLDQGGK